MTQVEIGRFLSDRAKRSAVSEVSSEAVRLVIKGLSCNSQYEETARQILSKYGLACPRAGRWYSQDDLTQVLRKVAAQNGPFVLYNVGIRIADVIDFPSDIDSTRQALKWLGTFHERSHRGESIGAYTIVETGMGSVTMVSTSLYPCDFDRGLIETTARRFRPARSCRVSLVHGESSCRKDGGDSCTYSVEW